MPSRLLVNFVYAPPVGHAIEALHYAHGYHLGDPDGRTSVAMVHSTPTELAELCPFLDRTYAVPVDPSATEDEAAAAARSLPRGWTHVVEEGRMREPESRALFPALAAYYDACDEHLVADTVTPAGCTPPAYVRSLDFRLTMPDAARERAEVRLGAGRPRIAVLPGGSAARSAYPSMASWRLILDALWRRFPDATFCFVGKLGVDGRTRTTFGRAEYDELRSVVPSSVEALDLPIVEQLAVVAGCDVVVSPHSGFGMAALAAGTPWLSLAGNRWPEYYFNGVPFYSVLPDVERFPCYSMFGPDPELVDDDGPRTPSMSGARIGADLDEIVEGAVRLVERRWTFDQAMGHHVRRLLRLRGGDASLLYSIDDVHRRYLPADAGA